MTALLDRRQAVLYGAKGRLGKMLEAQRRGSAQRAAAARKQALERVRSDSERCHSRLRPARWGARASSAAQGARPMPRPPASPCSIWACPYVWGGATPSGFDCSGLASYVYAKVGKSVPHYTGAIWAAFPKVSGPLQPGDLVFFHGFGPHGDLHRRRANGACAPHRRRRQGRLVSRTRRLRRGRPPLASDVRAGAGRSVALAWSLGRRET